MRVITRLREHGWELTAAVLCVCHAFWPGDVAYVNDEPLLIAAALEANRQGLVAVHGLMGTQGAVYGPLPTWLYQAYLLVSHDLVGLVALRALLSAAVITASLRWLSKTLSLWPGFIVVPLCSPWLWLYGRALWDNTFNLSLSAVAIAAWVAFFKAPSRWPLVVTIGALSASLLVHLMAVALVLPIVLHALVFRLRELYRFKGTVVLCVAGWAGLSWPYLRYLHEHRGGGGALLHAPLEAWAFALQGARLLAAGRVGEIFGAQWVAAGPPGWAPVMNGVIAVSALAFPLLWLGMALAAWRVIRGWRRGERPLLAHVSGLLLAVIGAQSLLNGATGKYGHSHYFNATWVVFAVVAWLLLDALHRWPRVRLALGGAWAVSLLMVTATIAVRARLEGLSREGPGAPLGNQVAVVAELKRYPASSRVRVEVVNYQRFPHALNTLMQLAEPSGPPLPAADLVIGYQTTAPLDGRITLRVVDSRE